MRSAEGFNVASKISAVSSPNSVALPDSCKMDANSSAAADVYRDTNTYRGLCRPAGAVKAYLGES